MACRLVPLHPALKHLACTRDVLEELLKVGIFVPELIDMWEEGDSAVEEVAGMLNVAALELHLVAGMARYRLTAARSDDEDLEVLRAARDAVVHGLEDHHSAFEAFTGHLGTRDVRESHRGQSGDKKQWNRTGERFCDQPGWTREGAGSTQCVQGGLKHPVSRP